MISLSESPGLYNARAQFIFPFYKASNQIFFRKESGNASESIPSTWGDWQQIYPDYTSQLFQNTGYICFTNKLIIMWTYWGAHMLDSNVQSQTRGNLTIYEKIGYITTSLLYHSAWNVAFLTFSDSQGIQAHIGYVGSYNFDTSKHTIFIDTLEVDSFDNINLNGTLWSFTKSN